MTEMINESRPTERERRAYSPQREDKSARVGKSISCRVERPGRATTSCYALFSFFFFFRSPLFRANFLPQMKNFAITVRDVSSRGTAGNVLTTCIANRVSKEKVISFRLISIGYRLIPPSSFGDKLKIVDRISNLERFRSSRPSLLIVNYTARSFATVCCS